MTKKAAYGLWSSPLSPEVLAQGIRLQDVSWSGDGERLVWLEGRSGKGVVVCGTLDGQAPRDLTAELSVRARVGYGGGSLVASGDQVWFASGGQLYRQGLGASIARPVTPAFGQAASPAVSADGRWMLYVHSDAGVDCLGIVDADGAQWPSKLAEGNDFYMQPAWHPDGKLVAWIAWDHPNMPWDGTLLHLGTLGEAEDHVPALCDDVVIAGGLEVSVFQPEFSPDGRYLSYVSDESGWWGLYLYDLESNLCRELWVEEAELAVPAWAQGMRTYAWAADSASLYVCRNCDGRSELYEVSVSTGVRSPVGPMSGYAAVSQPGVSSKGQVAMLAAGTRFGQRAVVWDPKSDSVTVMARATGETVPPETIVTAEAVEWDTTDGDRAKGLLYLPPSDGMGDNLPPLITYVHGGPTGQSLAQYSPNIQFFCTRGYAVLDVNYRGSAGYGRAYRDRLREQWGIYDADDAVYGARSLAKQGLVDGERMVVMGGSAGGYNVLQCLVRYPGVFAAGVCMFGVTNLFTLAADTHKFEQHYLDSMVGPLPETSDRYRERSPIFFADRISDPIAVFQGEEDVVVPKAQAETIVAALQRSGVPHIYHLYPGEGHGWRRAETISQFYSQVQAFLKEYVLFK